MSRQILILAYASSLIITLSACAPHSPDSTHNGMCNELNSRMIFSGSTSSIRNSEIQESELPLEQQNYDRKCT